ncbi:MAG TPA: hypothetical protein VMU43_04610 [Candidatus Acidoferrum sp.]|nr:hypothetical protein [Candidatus Acidoferrum sp.]
MKGPRKTHARFAGTRRTVVWSAVLAGVFILPCNCFGQDSKPVDRIYEHSQVEVQKALDAMNSFATERLPTLDGFVAANANTLDHFENPHYQLNINTEYQSPKQTLVEVSAKITAWYVSTDSSQSQYVVIPSNGRIENDFLDRLSISLEKGAAPPALSGAGVPAPTTVTGGVGNPSGVSGTSPNPATPAPSGANGADPPNPPVMSTDPAVLASEVATTRQDRQKIEQQERKTQEEISTLQTVSKNQKFLPNIAVIRTSQTPVFSAPDETSSILFRADPDDEFEMVEGKAGFVEVKLENGAMGWVRVEQLRQPSDTDDSADLSSSFNTANEQIKPFEGDWGQLKGKPTLFVFAEPSGKVPSGTLGQAQMNFAKQVFVEGYREASHTDKSVDGVVVVFLGEKGGVAAATLPDIRRWREGMIPDKDFLKRCSFDPPDSFRDAPKQN